MRFFSQRYSELPVEEKTEDERQPEVRPHNSGWSKQSVAFIVSILLLASFIFAYGATEFTGRSSKRPAVQPVMGEAEWLAHATRAAGDQYLLGVGKADITGYVNCLEFKYLWLTVIKASC